MKKPLILLLTSAALLALWPIGTLAATVAILLSGSGSGYAEVNEAIQGELRKQVNVRVLVGQAGPQPLDDMALSNSQLLIAVGAKAAQQALRQADDRTQILCVLLPRATFEALLAKQRQFDTRRVSAVYLDQPLSRQIELIRQALPHLTRVGTVFGPDSATDHERTRTLLDNRGLKLVNETLQGDSELFGALQRVMGGSEVFLAVPDALIINPDTAQNLLLTSLRFRIPVVGYSASLVRAGATLAVFSTPQQIGQQTGELARQILRGGSMPAPQYPRYFSVLSNRQMANSLNLGLDDDSSLKERLLRLEREQ
jgi:putative ABC transport system substrate-binding protein